jgi:hypothetical protein
MIACKEAQMDREQQPLDMTPTPDDRPDATVDYGGLDHDLHTIDLEHADDVGGDPPGSGLDIGGGSHVIGADAEEGDADGSAT